MVVAGLHAQGQPLAGRLGRLHQKFGLQLLGQEGIGVALIDQDVVVDAVGRAGLDQQGRVGTLRSRDGVRVASLTKEKPAKEVCREKAPRWKS